MASLLLNEAMSRPPLASMSASASILPVSDVGFSSRMEVYKVRRGWTAPQVLILPPTFILAISAPVVLLS